MDGGSISRLDPFRTLDIRREFHRFLSPMQGLEASVGSRQQQCPLELAKDHGGEQSGTFQAEAFKPACEFVLPALEGVAGGRAKYIGLRRGFQRGGRNRTTLRIVGA